MVILLRLVTLSIATVLCVGCGSPQPGGADTGFGVPARESDTSFHPESDTSALPNTTGASTNRGPPTTPSSSVTVSRMGRSRFCCPHPKSSTTESASTIAIAMAWDLSSPGLRST